LPNCSRAWFAQEASRERTWSKVTQRLKSWPKPPPASSRLAGTSGIVTSPSRRRNNRFRAFARSLSATVQTARHRRGSPSFA